MGRWPWVLGDRTVSHCLRFWMGLLMCALLAALAKQLTSFTVPRIAQLMKLFPSLVHVLRMPSPRTNVSAGPRVPRDVPRTVWGCGLASSPGLMHLLVEPAQVARRALQASLLRFPTCGTL